MHTSGAVCKSLTEIKCNSKQCNSRSVITARKSWIDGFVIFVCESPDFGYSRSCAPNNHGLITNRDGSMITASQTQRVTKLAPLVISELSNRIYI